MMEEFTMIVLGAIVAYMLILGTIAGVAIIGACAVAAVLHELEKD